MYTDYIVDTETKFKYLTKKHQLPSGKDEIVRQRWHHDYIRRQETGNTRDHRAETDANAPNVSRIQLAHCHILC